MISPLLKALKTLLNFVQVVSARPNARSYNDLVQAVIDSQPDKSNKQLYCLHFTFTPNAKFIFSHMSNKNKAHNLATLLDDEKEEKAGGKSNWSYLISLLRTRTDTKRDININVVDFLNGMNAHRVILLNFHKVKKSQPSRSTLPLMSHHSQNVMREVPRHHEKKDDENKLKKTQSASIFKKRKK